MAPESLLRARPDSPPEHAEHDPEIRESVPGMDEAVETYDITHRDGKRRRTIFINSPDFRSRLLKMGWEDVTEASFGAALAAENKAPETASAASVETGKGRRAPPAGRGVVASVKG